MPGGMCSITLSVSNEVPQEFHVLILQYLHRLMRVSIAGSSAEMPMELRTKLIIASLIFYLRKHLEATYTMPHYHYFSLTYSKLSDSARLLKILSTECAFKG